MYTGKWAPVIDWGLIITFGILAGVVAGLWLFWGN